jgi:hypothetical protein
MRQFFDLRLASLDVSIASVFRYARYWLSLSNTSSAVQHVLLVL